jgi:hypothetical protein
MRSLHGQCNSASLRDEKMSVMPQIVQYSRGASEQEIAAMRRDIEASGLHVIGEPEISRVPNEGYIREPDAPSECYRVVFQVEEE